jgi:hypothetical protein
MEMVRVTEREELERILEKGGVTFLKVLFRLESLRKISKIICFQADIRNADPSNTREGKCPLFSNM